MNRKTIVRLMIALSVIALAACSTAAPAAPSTGSNPNPTSPTASISTAVDTAVPSTSKAAMDPSLACSNGKTSATVTPELTEGPYYKTGSPEAANLYQEGMAGIKLIVTGYVYDINCQPVANTWLDFWQADANGTYDNTGYTLRGHQYTDANGHYTLTTVVPGLYPGRTEHIHFKVQASNGRVITSQLFFPGVAQNDSDGIFNASLLLPVQETGDGMTAQFNFIVPTQ